MQFRTLFQATRPSFLILSPVCVFLGTSTAIAAQAHIDASVLFLIFVGALGAHIGVNTLNEYSDFKSGLDLLTIKTPFSGGSGALPRSPAMATIVLIAAITAISVTAAIGIYFIRSHSILILPIGITGLVIILTYTKWINRWPLLCLVAPGLGFGTLMVVGTHLVLTGESAVTPWLASLVPFFLVNNLLLLNQYPDIDADKRIGRYHFPIAFGIRTSNTIYGLFFTSAYLGILIGVYLGYFPVLSLAALLPAIFSLFSMTGAFKHGEKIGLHPEYLGSNVAATLLTPLLLGMTIMHG
jgi:1,4-dihydroxy-2-naphthoate octaprenyltransferase